jgi:hypothetical protein
MSFVYDAANNGSDLVILNADDLTAPPTATIRLPAEYRPASTATGYPTPPDMTTWRDLLNTTDRATQPRPCTPHL